MVVYKDSDTTIPRDEAYTIVSIVEAEELKPWTVISRMSGDSELSHDEIRMQVLKPLLLEGVLTVTANGDLRVYKKEQLDELVN